MGGGEAYSIGAITVLQAYYRQTLNFLCALLIVLTTQGGDDVGALAFRQFKMKEL